MDQQVLWFILLLPALSCSDSEVTIVKTIGREPDTTPICTNETVDLIVLIICKIRTERGEDCRLTYIKRDGRAFEGDCDSRFRLMTENQTVFLYLTSLTPEDSGIYACQCSHADGTYITNLNVTVKDPAPPHSDSQTASSLILVFIVIAFCGFILGSGLLIGFTVHKICSRNNPRTEVSVPPASVLLSSLDQDEQENPYESLQEPASDVYQTIPSEDAKKNDTATRDHGEVYENLCTKT